MSAPIVLDLFGRMAAAFGPRHELYVESPAEALRLMAVNYAGFDRALAAEEELFLVVDDTPYDLGAVHGRVSRRVALVPVAEGRKEGWQTGLMIAGVALLAATGIGLAFGGQMVMNAAGAMVPAAGFMGTAGLAAAASNAFIYFGLSYAISAAVGYATRNDGVEEADTAKQRLGSTFGGAINTTQVGLPVPIGYGRLRVGSFVLSTSITPVDRPDLLSQGL